MKNCVMAISKEDYEEIINLNKNGYLTNELESRYFNQSIICGYGLYGCRAYKTSDGYELRYSIGDSCD